MFYKIGIRRSGCRWEDESYGGLNECLQASHDAIQLLPNKRRPAPLHIASPLSSSDLFKTAHIAVGSFEFDAKGNARDSREHVAAFVHCPQRSQKQGICYDRKPRNPV
jgi:hypothetical protein